MGKKIIMKDKIELLIAYADGADIESIINNTKDIDSTMEIIDLMIEILER